MHPIVSNKAYIAEALVLAFVAAMAVFAATYMNASTQLMDKTVITHLFSAAPGTVCAMISVKSSSNVGINVLNTVESKAFFADGTGDIDRFVMPSMGGTYVMGGDETNNNGKGAFSMEMSKQFFANNAACKRELGADQSAADSHCAQLAGTLATAPVNVTVDNPGHVSTAGLHCEAAAPPASGFFFYKGSNSKTLPAQNVPADFNCRAKFKALFCDSGLFAARAPTVVCDEHFTNTPPFSCTSRVPKLTTSESLAVAFSNANAAWMVMLSASVFFMHHCCRMQHDDDSPKLPVTAPAAGGNKDKVVPFDDF